MDTKISLQSNYFVRATGHFLRTNFFEMFINLISELRNNPTQTQTLFSFTEKPGTLYPTNYQQWRSIPSSATPVSS